MMEAGIMFSGIFWLFVFLLFLIGTARIIFSVRNFREALIFARIILVIIFFFSFLLYYLAGLMNIKFGWTRNFFYLLPIYLLVVFYGLKGVVINKKYYYAVSAFVLIIWGYTAVVGGSLWERVNLEREMVRCASQINSDLIIVVYNYDEAVRAFEYNARRYNIQNRVLYFSKHNPAYFDIFERISKAKTFVIIECLQKDALIKKDEYWLGERSFDILNAYEYKTDAGPFQFLNNFNLRSNFHIVVYFCKV